MILDSSAIVAIVLREPGVERLLDRLIAASSVAVGIPTLTETAIDLSSRLGRDTRGLLSRFLQEGSIITVPFGEPHWGVSVDAWLRYGKGRHPAALNFVDCMSYATAKVAAEPLLCVGEDFARTDLDLA